MKQVRIWLLLGLFLGLCSLSFAANTQRYVVFFKRSVEINRNLSGKNLINSLKQELDKSIATVVTQIKRDAIRDKFWSSNAVVVNLSQDDLTKLKALENVLEISKANQRFLVPEGEERTVIAPERAAQWGVRQIRAPKAWDEFEVKGGGVVVGCIDSGIFSDHPTFKDQIIAYKDFTRGGNSTKPSDGIGHGTHVAGIIAGHKLGFGVAPEAKLLIAKIFDNNGRTTLETILKAMEWMLSPSKTNQNVAPRVVNCSWSSKSTNSKQFWNIIDAWTAANIIPVFGAGNNGNMGGKVGAPGNYPHSFAVGATQKKDQYFAISCQGPAKWDGKDYIKPDMTAPGRNILSAGINGGSLLKSGTSMAAPHIAGTIALMLSANPVLKNEDIIRILQETAVDLGEAGADNKFGYGRVDAYTAVKKAFESFDFINAAEELNKLMDQEFALTNDENNSCLSDGFALYLVSYGRNLSAVEFQKLFDRIKARGSAESLELIEEIKKVRTFEELQNN